MKSNRPIIGVTGPKRGGSAAWFFTRLAVWMQGGKAVRITPGNTASDYELDALILGGGADIHPERYGQHLGGDYEIPSSKPSGLRQWLNRITSVIFSPFIFLIRKVLSVSTPSTDSERDELELTLLNTAIQEGLPVLGICRGAQLINIKMGGTLYQEIDGFYGEVPRIHSIWPKKKVVINSDSRLADIIGRPVILVNALHHQAVEKLGNPLKVVAREESGIIQAIEYPEHPFLIGVQWHPEYMPQIYHQRRIFNALVKAARNSEQGSIIRDQ